LATEVNRLVNNVCISTIVLSDNEKGDHRSKNPLDLSPYAKLESPSVIYSDSHASRIVKDLKTRGFGLSLGHLWFAGIEGAFGNGAAYVFYFPLDVDWEFNKDKNSVVGPEGVSQLIQAVDDGPNVILGNYRTESAEKETTEHRILGAVEGIFSDHVAYSVFREYFRGKNAIRRIRSEFFGISRKAFDSFRLIDVGSQDPTIQLVLHAILNSLPINTVDLGVYKTQPPNDPDWQFDRAIPIIRQYRARFQNWA